LPHVALRAQPFGKMGRAPCRVVQDPLTGERSLGGGVGSGDLRYGSPSVSHRGKALVWGLCSPFPAIKVDARAPVPYGVGATVSDIGPPLVNHAGVIDVFSLYKC